MSSKGHGCARCDQSLSKGKAGGVAIDKVTVSLSARILSCFCGIHPPPQGVDSHENDLVEYAFGSMIAIEQAQPQLFILHFFKCRQARQEGLVGKEARRKDQNGNGYQQVGQDKGDMF
jgi:hypothetical protein